MAKTSHHKLRSFILELIVYTALVVAYVAVALRFLDRWLKGLYDNRRLTYALVALVLIIGQGIVLEMATSALLKLVRSRTD